ncbi:acyl-CoA dehydrogenase family protein [Desulfosarcina ovata]|uniref:Butyryl-CoA dehydrogenase n=1 Tax=Desulfosarcina ovata subsp. ovata TaxID=2752305 RepID=A0A5K8AI24_9BACT|nr:acyl-CoA dehydrogenase family protein [Desulfosarcina ovata]BBO92345.1 butyryl-CoA dehydrogenase [Desulfosarcina ovata subsp. ovata]
MDFEFSKHQKMIQKEVRHFAQEELAPRYQQWDREKRYPRELVKKMGDLGFIGVSVSQENGGLGESFVTEGIVCEEISRGDCSISMSTNVANHLCGGLLEQGHKEAKDTFLKPFLAGEKIPAFCLTEPGCGTDAAALQTRAEKKGAAYVLNGEKSGITAIMDADFALVFAKTDPDAGAQGVSCFVIPMDLPGVSTQSYEDLGCNAVVRGSLFLQDVEIPQTYLIGQEGKGFRLAMQGFDQSRILLCLEALAPAFVSLEETMDYVKQRQAFGRPLATFEGVSFPIIEHVSLLEAVRLLCYKALWLRDQGRSSSKEAGMVKWMAPRFSTNAIRDCIVLHGHYGYTKDYPLEQRLRDVLAIEIADGTSQVSKLVVHREMMGKKFLPYNYRYYR